MLVLIPLVILVETTIAFMPPVNASVYVTLPGLIGGIGSTSLLTPTVFELPSVVIGLFDDHLKD